VAGGYLTLERAAASLSGGEAQRIRLATQIGSSLMGVLYILDEPSIGLHQRDNARLLATLTRLRDLGNTVIVVEHDEDTMRAADHIVDMGPGAGEHGGRVVALGTAAEVMANEDSITGAYLSARRGPVGARLRGLRQGDRHRPVPDRPHPAVEPGHLHRGVRPHPVAVRADARGEDAGLQAGPLLLQRQGRPLRELPWRRHDQDR